MYTEKLVIYSGKNWKWTFAHSYFWKSIKHFNSKEIIGMILMFGKQNNFSLKNIQIASLSAYTALLTVFLVNLVAVFLSIL